MAKKTAELNELAEKTPLLLRPFQAFFDLEAAGGILLMVCTVIALVWANSPWADSYEQLWQTRLSISLNGNALAKPLLLWINDGLMAVFFLLVGLEIKREVLIGELASARRAALPVAAALGGLLTPAVLYLIVTAGTPEASGWGVPIATDIAFAIGILALLGDRIPTALKVFLTALAIVDDIGAVLVIAFFYTSEIEWIFLAVALGLLVVLIFVNRSGIHRLLVFAILGVGLWFALLQSGVHATLAGVLLAMVIPAQAKLNPETFLQRGRGILERFEHADQGEGRILTNETRQAAIHALETSSERVQSPLLRMEHALHSWVMLLVMPLFALANAGVRLEGDLLSTLTQPAATGIVLGLVIGKPLGITLFAWLATRLDLAEKPEGVSWLQVNGAGWLAGIGFTMSLFISNLAFGSDLLSTAKIGILVASLVAGTVGWILLSRLKTQ